MDFDGKRILVTGSTRGIGRTLAEFFHGAGAHVALNGRDAAAVAATADALGGGERVVAAPGDVASAAGCDAVVGRALAGLAGLDILVNNAGLYPIASIEDSDETLWDSVMDANAKSVFFCSRAALAALRASRGVIINHSSIAGLMGFANLPIYCASKGAVTNLTRSMAMELAPDVRVNCVCPTTVDNEMGWEGFRRAADPGAAHAAFVAASNLKRMATNDDVVAAIAFLASDEAGFLTGVALPVDGGKSAGA